MRGGAPPARLGAIVMLTVALILGLPRHAFAQHCAGGSRNSCLSVSFTPVRPAPEPADFAAGVGVLGSLSITVLKCGRPPCDLTVGATNQPPTGLRLKVGGGAPVSLAECGVDITGVSNPNSGRAPSLALVNGPTTLAVWICQPLSWNPAQTPSGSWTPELRFRLRQS